MATSATRPRGRPTTPICRSTSRPCAPTTTSSRRCPPGWCRRRPVPRDPSDVEGELVALLAGWVADVRPESLLHPPGSLPVAVQVMDSPDAARRTSRWPRSGRPPRCGRCWSTRTPSPSRSRAAGRPARAPTCCAPRPGWRPIALIGSGVVVRSYDAHPGDSLWVVAKVVFPAKSRSVEAATAVSTALNTARVALESGRIDEARAAFQTVQDQLAAVDDADGRAELAHQRDYLTTQLSSPAHPAAEQRRRAHRGPAARDRPGGRHDPVEPLASPREPRRPSSYPRPRPRRASSPPRPATPRRRHRGPAAPPRPQRAELGPGRRGRPARRPRRVRTARGQRARPVRCGLRRRPRNRRRPPPCRPPTRSPTRPRRRRARSRPRPLRAPADPATPAAVHARAARRNGASGPAVRLRQLAKSPARPADSPASDDSSGGSTSRQRRQRLLAELVDSSSGGSRRGGLVGVPRTTPRRLVGRRLVLRRRFGRRSGEHHRAPGAEGDARPRAPRSRSTGSPDPRSARSPAWWRTTGADGARGRDRHGRLRVVSGPLRRRSRCPRACRSPRPSARRGPGRSPRGSPARASRSP